MSRAVLSARTIFCAHNFARIIFYAQRQALNRPLFQRDSTCYKPTHTHKIVVLDTAWPWASEAYGICRLCAYFCAHKLIRAKSYGLSRSTNRCFKRATKSIVVLDTAWSWANDTPGFCCLRAYFCARKLIRARSFVVIPQIKIIIGVLTANKNELAARALSTGCGVGVTSPRRWRCELAERTFKTGTGVSVSWLCALRGRRKLAVQATYILIPVTCQQVVGFCLSGSMLVV